MNEDKLRQEHRQRVDCYYGEGYRVELLNRDKEDLATGKVKLWV